MIETGLPLLTGSYSLIMGFAVDFGMITLCLGGITGILGVFQKSLSLRREYLSYKMDKAKADKMIKDLTDNDSTNDDKYLKDIGSNI